LFSEVRILNELWVYLAEVRILMGLKSFILIRIRGALEVLILRGLVAMTGEVVGEDTDTRPCFLPSNPTIIA